MERSKVEDIISEWAGPEQGPKEASNGSTGQRHNNTQASTQSAPRQAQKRPEIAGVEPKRYSDLIKNKSNKPKHNNRPRRRK